MRTTGGRAPGGLILSGLWIAGIGFFITRFTVTLAAYETRTQFLIAGVVPLVVGLLLAVVGVAFVVGTFDPSFVRTVALWCTAGTLAMAAMVALTLAGTSDGGAAAGTVLPAAIVSNFLIGGAVLGALTGVYAGKNRDTRAKLRQRANQLVTMNRILRHEVLNAVAVIRGRAEIMDGAAPGRVTPGHILEEADHIVDTIEDVKYLTRTAQPTDELYPVDPLAAVDESLEAARDRFPDVTFTVDGDRASECRVLADGQLRHALYPLVENAATYGDSDVREVHVEVDVVRDRASIRVMDTGSGLPEDHRATLERGEIPDYDDPSAGFGTNIARMYVDRYGGDIRTHVTDEGTTVEVMLQVVSAEGSTIGEGRPFGSVGVGRSSLLVATGAALVAGGLMGLYMQVSAGVIPVIGALYGVTDPLVGWITHEFHSVVFGLVYAGLVTLLPGDRGHRLVDRLAVGIAWGLFLWLIAAGVVMPFWLNLVGIPSAVPSVSWLAFKTHLLWGVSLSVVYHLGTELVGSR